MMIYLMLKMKLKWIIYHFLDGPILFLVAPATANTISKLSAGSSDDLASTVFLASRQRYFFSTSYECEDVGTPFN